MSFPLKVAVIGGGPAGLATLKFLATAHDFFPGIPALEIRLFEAQAEIGGTFVYRVYEDAEVRPLCCFSYVFNLNASFIHLHVFRWSHQNT